MHDWWDIRNVLLTTGEDDDYYSTTDKELLHHQATQEMGMWGVAISIVSAVFMSAGLCLQKMVAQNAAANPSRGPAHKQSMYMAGIGYVSMGFVMRMVVHAMLPLSAIAPLSSFTVIFTTLLEYLILKTDIDSITMACLALVFLGTLMSILGANLSDEEYSFEILRPMFLDKTSVIMSVTLFAFIFTCREFLRNTASASSFSSHSGQELREFSAFSGTIGLVYLSLSSAIFAGWFSTAVKTSVEILKYAFLHGLKLHLFRHPGIYLLALSLPAFGIPKMKYTWFALSVFHPLQFMPLYQSATIAANAICGLVYYQDFDSRRIVGSRVYPALYFLGLGMICAGLAAMTFRYNPAKHFPSSTAAVDTDGFDEAQGLLGMLPGMLDDAEGGFIAEYTHGRPPPHPATSRGHGHGHGHSSRNPFGDNDDVNGQVYREGDIFYESQYGSTQKRQGDGSNAHRGSGRGRQQDCDHDQGPSQGQGQGQGRGGRGRGGVVVKSGYMGSSEEEGVRLPSRVASGSNSEALSDGAYGVSTVSPANFNRRTTRGGGGGGFSGVASEANSVEEAALLPRPQLLQPAPVARSSSGGSGGSGGSSSARGSVSSTPPQGRVSLGSDVITNTVYDDGTGGASTTGHHGYASSRLNDSMSTATTIPAGRLTHPSQQSALPYSDLMSVDSAGTGTAGDGHLHNTTSNMSHVSYRSQGTNSNALPGPLPLPDDQSYISSASHSHSHNTNHSHSHSHSHGHRSQSRAGHPVRSDRDRDRDRDRDSDRDRDRDSGRDRDRDSGRDRPSRTQGTTSSNGGNSSGGDSGREAFAALFTGSVGTAPGNR